MKVEVTAEDIEKGVPGRCHSCPIARAVERQGLFRISVSTSKIEQYAEFNPHMLVREWRLPPEATDFVLAFDWRKPVRPFTFEAELLWERKNK